MAAHQNAERTPSLFGKRQGFVSIPILPIPTQTSRFASPLEILLILFRFYSLALPWSGPAISHRLPLTNTFPARPWRKGTSSSASVSPPVRHRPATNHHGDQQVRRVVSAPARLAQCALRRLHRRRGPATRQREPESRVWIRGLRGAGEQWRPRRQRCQGLSAGDAKPEGPV